MNVFNKKFFYPKVASFTAKLIILGFVAVLTLSCASQKGNAKPSQLPDKSPALTRDSAILSGVMQNGMSYFILKNEEPKNRIFLRLAVQVGSILEQDDQKGLAHFVEHMAFNGTEHFEKNELVSYFESIGMSFGPEVNAYTSFDETVYMLEIPADSPEILEQALLVLRDWACAIRFDQEELDKERGVVIEEWRLGRGANGRVQDKQIPFIFGGSRYAERLPIGDPEIIKTINRERVVDFYKTWYRPELMSVTIVGDAKTETLQEALNSSLGTIPAQKNGIKRKSYSATFQKDPAVLIYKDPEIPYTTVQILEQHPAVSLATESSLRDALVNSIACAAFNNRINEITLGGNTDLLAAGLGSQRMIKSLQFSFLAFVPSPGNFDAAFSLAMTELERIEKYGITSEELEREKTNLLQSVKQAWLDRDKQHSANLSGAIVQDYLYGDTAISLQDRYYLYNRLIPSISLDDIAKKINTWFTGRGKLLMLTSSENAEDIPSEAALLSLWQNWNSSTSLASYEEKNLDRPLYSTETKEVKGSILSEEKLPFGNAFKWKLSNGAFVIGYPTDYKTNEILMSAWSKGGISLVSDADFPSAAIATSYAQNSGLNGFNAAELQKHLAGKMVSAGVWLDEAYEGLWGSSSVEDLETLFQIAALQFMQPEFSQGAWQNLYAQLETIAASRKTDPNEVFADLKNKLLYGNNLRRSNLSQELVKAMDAKTSEKAYRERFAGAGDFTFVFVGSFDKNKLKTLCETYLAVLPAGNITEDARPLNISFPTGITAENLSMGIDPKSRVYACFGGKTKIASDDYELFNALLSLLDIKLRESIREDMSGSYGIQVGGQLIGYPEESYEISIEFGCEPGREEELFAAVLKVIEKVKNGEITPTDVEKLRENYRRERETGLRNNNWWLSQIVTKEMQEIPLTTIEDGEHIPSLITAQKLSSLARNYLNTSNYVKAVLIPAKK